MKKKIVLLSCSMILALYIQGYAKEMNINIISQSLSSAIIELTEQTKLQILVSQDVLKGKIAPAIKGKMEPKEALTQLLKNSGLEVTEKNGLVIINQKKILSHELERILITGEYEANEGSSEVGYKPETAKVTGPWGIKPILDTPYSISSTSAELIENIIAPSTDKVIKYNPVAVQTSTTAYGSSDGFIEAMLRGFKINEVVRDGIPITRSYFSSTLIDLERVEILTGLSGFLYGANQVGGRFNLVSKRPTKERLTNITVGNYGGEQYYSHADLGGPIDEKGKFGYRINAFTTSGETMIKNQYVDQDVLSGAFDWHIKDNILFQVEASHQKSHIDKPTNNLGLWGASKYPSANSLDNKNTYTFDWTDSNLESNRIGSNFDWDFSDTLSLRSGYIYYKEERSNKSASFYLLQNDEIEVDYNKSGPFTLDNDGAYVYLDKSFDIFDIGHKVTMGANFNSYKYSLHKDYNHYEERYYSDLDDAYENDDEPDWPILNTEPKYTSSKQKYINYILGDEITFNEQYSMLIGANHATIDTKAYNSDSEKIGSYSKSALTPTFSLIYKPIPNVSFYTNYMEALESGGTVSTSSYYRNAGDILEPTISKQAEIGIKTEVGKLLLTAAAYEIDKANRYDVYHDDGTRTRTQDGRQIHKGLEFTATGKIMDSLSIFAGASFVDAKITKTNSTTKAGKLVLNLPKQKYSLYLEYELPFVKKLFLNAGLVHIGGIQYSVNKLNTIEKFPSYRTLDTGLRYETKLFDRALIARLNVSNVTDKKYWANGSLGDPLTVSYSITMKF